MVNFDVDDVASEVAGAASEAVGDAVKEAVDAALSEVDISDVAEVLREIRNAGVTFRLDAHRFEDGILQQQVKLLEQIDDKLGDIVMYVMVLCGLALKQTRITGDEAFETLEDDQRKSEAAANSS